MRVLAKTFSVLLHPLLMPSYILFILFSSGEYIGFNLNQKLKLIIYGIIFTNTFLFPGLLSLFLLQNKKISSLEMEDKTERRLPYLITATFYILTYYLLQKFNLSVLVYIVMLGASTAILIAMFINFKWKISAHMVGIGGLIGVLTGLTIRLHMNFIFLIVLFILLAGFLGTARLILKAHVPSQIFVGFFVGCFTQLSLFIFL